jgi:GTP-binding protein
MISSRTVSAAAPASFAAARGSGGRRATAAVAAAAATMAPSSSSSPSSADRRSPAAAAAAAALPPGDFSRVRTAVFVGSAVDLRGCPPDGRRPEFALIGRSNVGKSSLLNMLAGRAGLARESKEPGMTQTINHYLINDSWHLVDLPGYGYAKTSKATQGAWLGFTKQYFLKRDSLVAVLLLIDATLPPQKIDLDCANWLAASEVPFAVVFTKADARKKGGPPPAQNVAAFQAALAEEWASLPACFLTSARDGTGKTELLAYLASLRRLDAEAA